MIRLVKNKKMFGVLLGVLLIFIVACTKTVKNDETEKIDVGTSSSEALNVLGDGKKMTGSEAILGVMERERVFIDKKIKELESDNDQEQLDIYYQSRLEVEAAIEVAKTSENLAMYKYKINDENDKGTESFYLVTATVENNDVVIAKIYEKN